MDSLISFQKMLNVYRNIWHVVMRTKEIVKMFVPPILNTCFTIVLGIVGRLRMQSVLRVGYNTKRGKKLFVMGNGPSAKDFFDNHLDSLEGCDCMAVNHFADTPLFEIVKPTQYLVADPIFFEDPEKLKDYQKKLAWDSIDYIINKLSWEMTIYMPLQAKGALSVIELSKNSFVTIRYYSCYGNSAKITSKNFKYYLWNHSCLAHLSQTVLNACLGVAIQMRYSEINLIGADTSWHEDYWMDQKTNVLYIVDKHFYGAEKVPIRDEAGNPTTIDQELYTGSVALKSYWDLAEYAKYNDVKIYNASAYSWIDAFERKML